eukprot:137694-Hanusia_phi.AAC.1
MAAKSACAPILLLLLFHSMIAGDPGKFGSQRDEKILFETISAGHGQRPDVVARRLFELSERAASKGDSPSAARLLLLIGRLFGSQTDLHVTLGDLYCKQRQHARSLNEFRQALVKLVRACAVGTGQCGRGSDHSKQIAAVSSRCG